MKKMIRICSLLIVASYILSGCMAAGMGGTKLAQPSQLTPPTPIQGNSGKFMSPYTSDGVLADWVDKAINAKMGSQVGGLAGAYAGQKMAENIPFVGGFLGQKMGAELGRKVALEASGGEKYIKESSDLSFDSVNDLAVHLYSKHSTHKHYQDALDATFQIYPELKMSYFPAIQAASRTIR